LVVSANPKLMTKSTKPANLAYMLDAPHGRFRGWRIVQVIAGLTYAGVIVLLICAAAVGANFAIAESSPPVPLVIDVIAAECAVASFGTFFSMPWRLLAFPIAAGMFAHAARWVLISLAGRSAPTGALVACMLVSVLATPVADRLHLPFAALAFSAVVSLMPGFFLFNAATGLVELVSIGRARQRLC
jgi:uncharacterized membrane protein YjjB (DUF3815 family)